MTPDSMTPAGLARASEPTPQPALAFTGRRGPLLRLLLKNLALTLLTVGIYRFWAKTAVRRYFWSHITILGDPLEYAGTGKELLIGFLTAMLFLVPLGIAYGAIDLLIGPVLSPERIAIEIAYYVLLLFLIQVAIYRVWRYRLSRTLWRGIRFGLDGSSLGYAAISMGWLFLTAVTLGAAYPWRSMALWRYRQNHARFGSTAFTFEAQAGSLLPWWLLCLPWPVVAVMAMRYGLDTGRMMIAGAGLLTAVCAGSLCYMLYRVKEARVVIASTRLGEVRFETRLRATPILAAALAVVAVFAAALYVVIGAVMAVRAEAAGGVPPLMLDAGALAILSSIGVVTVVLPMLTTVVLQVAVVRALAATTTVDRPDLLEQVAQSTGQGPSFGEGLADAFDVGAV